MIMTCWDAIAWNDIVMLDIWAWLELWWNIVVIIHKYAIALNCIVLWFTRKCDMWRIWGCVIMRWESWATHIATDVRNETEQADSLTNGYLIDIKNDMWDGQAEMGI